MELIAHLNQLVAQAPAATNQTFDASQMNQIVRMADTDRFLDQKLRHLRHMATDHSSAPDQRLRYALGEYQEALAYIHLSKEF